MHPIVPALVSLLAHSGNRPRVHGNGFVQLDLGPRIRLHVWGDPRIPRQKVDTPIHNHTFGFTSYVLLGGVTNVIYRETGILHGGAAFIPHRAVVRDGEDTRLEPLNEGVFLSRYHTRHVPAGQSYSMMAGEIHETIIDELSVSVDVKDGPSLAQGGPSPTVYVRPNVTPDNEFNRYDADPALIWQVISDAVGSALRLTQEVAR